MNEIDLSTDAAITNAFHKRYYEQPLRTWSNTNWMGWQTLKCPLDMWVYQEIIFETRPDIIIETGTHKGGSALFLAMMLDCMSTCVAENVSPRKIVSIDIEVYERPIHPRVTYLTGSSVSNEVVSAVRAELDRNKAERVMVILDSDHRKSHVSAELQVYAPLVTSGCYMIIEDTNVNGNPVYKDFGPGPMEAVVEFLAGTTEFERDESREKYYMTFNPCGFLKKK